MKLLMLLQSFHAVAAAGSVTAAARRLGVSQPTLSEQLAELERHFGVELFFRRGRRLAITPLGQQLRGVTHRLSELELEAQSLLGANACGLSGQLHLAAVGPYNLMKLLRGFCQRHPQLQVQVVAGDSATVLQRVLDYAADLALIVEAPADDRLLSLPLQRQPLWLMVPPGHRLAGARRVRLGDLADEPFVLRDVGSTTQRVFERCLAEAGVAVHARVRLSSREAVREAVIQRLGLGVVSAQGFVPGAGLVGVPFEEPGMATHAHLVWLASRHASRLVRAFVEHAQQVQASCAVAGHRVEMDGSPHKPSCDP